MLAWLKRPGDAVERGEPLVEVETDKATIVYEAETAGILDEILSSATAKPRPSASRSRACAVPRRPLEPPLRPT